MVAVTAVTDWVAVAPAGPRGRLGRHRPAADRALAVVTLAPRALRSACAGTRRAGDGARLAPAPDDPDWADDVLAGAGELAGRCGAAGRAAAVRWNGRAVVVGGGTDCAGTGWPPRAGRRRGVGLLDPSRRRWVTALGPHSRRGGGRRGS